MSCPDWIRKDMRKTSVTNTGSKTKSNVRDMGSLFHGAKGYADGGEVETLKQEGLKASAGENVGFWDRIKAGNIDDPNSEAYRRFGAGRGAEERLQKSEDARDAAMSDIVRKGKPVDDRNEMDKASDAAAAAPKPSAPKPKPAAAPRKFKDTGGEMAYPNSATSIPKTPAQKPESSKAPSSSPSRADVSVMFRDAERGGSTGLKNLKRYLEDNELSLADSVRARRLLKERNAE